MDNQFTIEGPTRGALYSGGKALNATGVGGWASEQWVSHSIAKFSALDAADLAAFGHVIYDDGDTAAKDTIDICFMIGMHESKSTRSIDVTLHAAAYQCNTGDSTLANCGTASSSKLTLSTEARRHGACGTLTLQPSKWDGDCDIRVVLWLECNDQTGMGYLYCSYTMGLEL